MSSDSEATGFIFGSGESTNNGGEELSVHILVTDFKGDYQPLSTMSLGKLCSAAEQAIQAGMNDDVTMMVTLFSDVFLPDMALKSFINFLQNLPNVHRVSAIMSDSITLLTTGSFVVTIRFLGGNKFVDLADGKTISSRILEGRSND